jgi:hypothetical protein
LGKAKLLSHIIAGLLISALWIMIGIPIYIDSLVTLHFFNNFGMKYLIFFLWGIPAISVIFVAIYRKNLGYWASSISFLIGTIFFSLMIPVLLDP